MVTHSCIFCYSNQSSILRAADKQSTNVFALAIHAAGSSGEDRTCQNYVCTIVLYYSGT